MITQSCQNCWFNGLQYGALGLAVGYCALHKVILNYSEGTTCSHQRRKDLSLDRVGQVSEHHRDFFSSDQIVNLHRPELTSTEISNKEADFARLRKDTVGELVSDYSQFDSKIEFLAQLRRARGVRAELAMLSLSRVYVNNCFTNDGKWTSGIHLYWWTKSRLAEEPDIGVDDIRFTDGLNLSRQLELVSWSLIMLRLTFIADIALYASENGDPLAEAMGLLDEAANENHSFNISKLTRWMRREAVPFLDKLFSKDRYLELANTLRT
jgi:hypothetical protein